jgi:hypothetical protein
MHYTNTIQIEVEDGTVYHIIKSGFPNSFILLSEDGVFGAEMVEHRITDVELVKRFGDALKELLPKPFNVTQRIKLLQNRLEEDIMLPATLRMSSDEYHRIYQKIQKLKYG